jgi:hypothetical protein
MGMEKQPKSIKYHCKKEDDKTKMAMKTRKEEEKHTKMPMDYKLCRPQQPKRVNKLI